MNKLQLLISLLVLGGSMVCCKEINAPASPLDGVWIEQRDRSDTIVFGKLDGEPYLLLNRGREIRYGHDLPRYGSGIYHFQLKKDSISLLNSISSCSTCSGTYYFEIQGAELIIGDFYKKNSINPQSLTFIKK